MKCFASTAIAALAVGILAAPAAASDLSLKDRPGTDGFEAPRTVNWNGFYVGGRAGYGHSNHELSIEGYKNGTPESCPEAGECKPAVPGESVELFNLNGLDSSGFTGGGQVGFDVQRGRFVGGIFGSYDFSGAETTISGDGLPEIALIEQGDSWSVGARAGLLVNPRTLVYVLAAYTQTEFTFAGIGTEGADKDVTFNGVTAGAGVEFALTNNIFMGIEGTHTFYGSETLADSCKESCGEAGASGSRLHDEIDETRVLATLKIKLNAGVPGLLD